MPGYYERTDTFYFCCRFFLTGSQKRFFEKLSIYCDKYAEQIPVTFVLGKYQLHVKLFSNSVSGQAFSECQCMEAFQSSGAYGWLEAYNKIISFQQVSLNLSCFCHIDICADVLNIPKEDSSFLIFLYVYIYILCPLTLIHCAWYFKALNPLKVYNRRGDF